MLLEDRITCPGEISEVLLIMMHELKDWRLWETDDREAEKANQSSKKKNATWDAHNSHSQRNK